MAKQKNKQKQKQPALVIPSIRYENLKVVEPLTLTQKKVFAAYKKKNHLCLSGAAGTGKTFMAMYLALEEVMKGESPYDKIIIVRSIVPTRDIGFLPGDRSEKEATYLSPYIGILAELFGDKLAWNKLVAKGTVEFLTTSFVRGITLRKSMSWIQSLLVLVKIADSLCVATITNPTLRNPRTRAVSLTL